MDSLKSLDEIFHKKIFRIPDYQRGYAWQPNHLDDFWEDLINLPDNRSHYTGVLTLQEIKEEIEETDKKYWLNKEHQYTLYNVVDGQQRLTTCFIFLQVFINFIRKLSENKDKLDKDIYISGSSLNLKKDVIEIYLFKEKPTGDQFRTYKFGYTADHPSYEYMKYNICEEKGSPSPQETFYTLNLKNAKEYFTKQLKEICKQEGNKILYDIYTKLTKKFMFNEYKIKDEFDVFIAFETMNNRGKKLSDLELLKNRLIYLITLYTDEELEKDERKSIRDAINKAWKVVYYQLGRNTSRPLNDDEFLKAHWTMYFQYSRKKGNDYIKFLLDERFSPQKIYQKSAQKVDIETPQEHSIDSDINENEDDDYVEDDSIKETPRLKPKEIKRYVISLQESALHWFNSYYPDLSNELSDELKNAIDQLNRIGIGYFRPLVMSVLKNKKEEEKNKIILLKQIERFIFITFRLNQYHGTYRNSIFYNAAREFDKGNLNIEDIKQKLKENLYDFFNKENDTFKYNDFYNYIDKKFHTGKRNGYYGWHGLKYFLYEYELNLLDKSRQKKISWKDFLKTEKDGISIEHILPQTPDGSWKKIYDDVGEKNYHLCAGSLGNLLLLSKSINSSVKNDDFEDKKKPRYNDENEKVRNGYSDGSHSEIKVAHENEKWTPEEIKKRGLELLKFMEKRWDIKFESESVKEKLLFLPDNNE